MDSASWEVLALHKWLFATIQLFSTHVQNKRNTKLQFYCVLFVGYKFAIVNIHTLLEAFNFI